VSVDLIWARNGADTRRPARLTRSFMKQFPPNRRRRIRVRNSALTIQPSMKE
jgi:hypothetical protein